MPDTKDKEKAPEYDWSNVNGQAVDRLRAPKVFDVPAPIVALAQDSWDGQPTGEKNDKGEDIIGHVLSHNFGKGNEAMAAAFALHMKHAGDHTTPQTTVEAVIDPEGKGHGKHIVSWRAGKRRGRTSA